MRKSNAPSSIAKRSRPSAPVQRSRRFPVTKVPFNRSFGKAPFARQYVATLRYSEIITKVLTGGLNFHVFSCNGMFDPDITGTGRQPLYFDQLMALYDHYTVTSSYCVVKHLPQEAGLIGGSPETLCATLHIDDDNDASADLTLNKMRPDSSTTLMGRGFQNSIRMGWSAVKYFGPNPLANNSLQGNAVANPSEQSFFYLTIDAPGGATSTVRFLVEITYTVTFQELKTIGAS